MIKVQKITGISTVLGDGKTRHNEMNTSFAEWERTHVPGYQQVSVKRTGGEKVVYVYQKDNPVVTGLVTKVLFTEWVEEPEPDYATDLLERRLSTVEAQLRLVTTNRPTVERLEEKRDSLRSALAKLKTFDNNPWGRK